MSSGLDPDQARRFVGPGLNTNCLQRLSADGTSRQGDNYVADDSVRVSTIYFTWIIESEDLISTRTRDCDYRSSQSVLDLFPSFYVGSE